MNPELNTMVLENGWTKSLGLGSDLIAAKESFKSAVRSLKSVQALLRYRRFSAMRQKVAEQSESWSHNLLKAIAQQSALATWGQALSVRTTVTTRPGPSRFKVPNKDKQNSVHDRDHSQYKASSSSNKTRLLHLHHMLSCLHQKYLLYLLHLHQTCHLHLHEG
jgi:hypothetical protein